MIKFITITFLVISLSFIGLLAFYLPGCPSRGQLFGNNSDFNRVRAALESIDGVTIDQAWIRRDPGMGDFGFYFRYNNSLPIDLNIPQDSRLRDLSRAQLVEELQNLIKSKALWII